MNTSYRTLLVLFWVGSILPSCATVHNLLPGALAPAAVGEVKVKKDRNENEVLLIEVSHLPPPASLAEKNQVFVAWSSPDSENYTNLGQLKMGKDRSGELEAVTPAGNYEILITAEPSATVSEPGPHVVLRKVTKFTMVKMEESILDLESTNESMAAEMAGMQDSIEDLAEYRAALEAEIERLGGDKEALTEQFNEAQQKLDEAREMLEAESAALAKTHEELEKKNEQLEANQKALEKATDLLVEKKAALTLKTSVLAKHKEELEVKTEELKEKQAKLEKATAQLAEKKASLLASKEALEETTAELESKQAKLESKQAIIDQISEKQAQAEKRLDMLTSMLQQFKSMIEGGELSVVIREGKMILELPSAVLFKSGSAKITKKGKETLSKVASVLSSIEDRNLQIAGHTDDVPIKSKKFKSNWELSAARAISVVNLLVQEGIDPAILSAAGYGEHQPVADNSTEEGRSQNRRIEIVILPNLEELPDLQSLEKAL